MDKKKKFKKVITVDCINQYCLDCILEGREGCNLERFLENKITKQNDKYTITIEGKY